MSPISRRLARLPIAVLALCASSCLAADIALPAPHGDELEVTRILAARHDTTAFSSTALPAQDISNLLWASTGINRPTTGHRTSNYSYTSRDNEIYLLCAQGVFLYDQLEHRLTLQSATDLRPTLGGAAATAPITFVLVTYAPDIDFFGAIHTGFISENIALACADRGLGAHLSNTIPAGLSSALGLAAKRVIVGLHSIGYPEGTVVPGPAWAVRAGALVPAAVNDAPALKILKRRRSSRNFASTPFPVQTLADLVWAGLGINNPTTGERTSPSVTGADEIDLYALTATGVYRYHPGNGAAHYLQQVSTADLRGGLDYGSVPAIFLYVADYAKLTGSDSEKRRAACLHAGLVSQNVATYAAAQGLGELVRSDPASRVDRTALQLTADQQILFTHTLGYMSSAPGASTVTIAAGVGGTVTGTKSQSVAFGGTGTPVTAVPNPGYSFAYWAGLPGGRVPANPLTLPNVTSAMSLSAVFVADPVSYAEWRAANFFDKELTDDAISGPLADPDSAGVSNLQRYAHSLPARGPATAPTTLGTVDSGGERYLTIAFTRRATANDLSYIVESSPDLTTWTTLTTFTPGSPTLVTAQDSVAMGAGGNTRRFLRVRVQAAP